MRWLLKDIIQVRLENKDFANNFLNECGTGTVAGLSIEGH